MSEWTPPLPRDGVPFRQCAPEAVWRAAMELICEQNRLPTEGLAPMATGSDIVWGGRGFVIKMTRPRWSVESETERLMCAHLHGRLSVDVPAVLGYGTLTAWPYVVTQRLDGLVPIGEVWPRLSGTERRTLASRIGEVVAELHGLPVIDLPGGPWSPFAARMAETAEARMKRTGADPAWLPEVEPRVTALEHIPTRPVLLHTELLDQHLLLTDHSKPRLAGIIDFADGRVGHPDYEWPAVAEFIFKGASGCMRACLEAYGEPASDLHAERARTLVGWGLMHQFGSLTRACAAAGDPKPGDWAYLTQALYDL